MSDQHDGTNSGAVFAEAVLFIWQQMVLLCKLLYPPVHYLGMKSGDHVDQLDAPVVVEFMS